MTSLSFSCSVALTACKIEMRYAFLPVHAATQQIMILKINHRVQVWLWYFLCCFRVNDKYLVKIADFGMSQDMYEKNYIRDTNSSKPKPVKWMSLESLTEGLYNEKTDVVSVLCIYMYHIWTYNCV